MHNNVATMNVSFQKPRDHIKQVLVPQSMKVRGVLISRFPHVSRRKSNLGLG